MLTDFGRALRKIRIDHREIIRDMAEKLHVTASYLSAVETGKRKIPDHWVKTISNDYHLDEMATKELEAAAIRSAKSLKLDIEDVQDCRREAAILFAREFKNIDDDTIEQIRNLLTKDEKGGC